MIDPSEYPMPDGSRMLMWRVLWPNRWFERSRRRFDAELANVITKTEGYEKKPEFVASRYGLEVYVTVPPMRDRNDFWVAPTHRTGGGL